MKTLLLKLSLVSVLVLMIGSAPAAADSTGYAFVFAYSLRSKTAYHSQIMTHPAKGQSLSEKEYCADIKLIRKMEDAFAKYLQTDRHLDVAQFSFSARTGYKTEAYALRQLEEDKADMRRQGLEMELVSGFTFTP